MFLRNSWYVIAWSDELANSRGLLGRVLLGEPVVVWRTSDGRLRAMEDRCPHRHAALSMGRVEGDTLRCMYHGMQFDAVGQCVGVPGMANPPAAAVRTYPVEERDDWIWVWMGDPAQADTALIPPAFGLNDPAMPMRHSSIVYDANYQLLHDNLCDLSHLDFTHETSLGPASGTRWSETQPRVTLKGRSVLIERWFEGAVLPTSPNEPVDTWMSYRFEVPGVFILRSGRYPVGTAAASNYGPPANDIVPLAENVDQQAVTPLDERQTHYFFATGLINRPGHRALDIDSRMAIIRTAFEEDRQMIEAQQRIHDRTPADAQMQFLPQDKAPSMMRRLMRNLMRAEAGEGAPVELAELAQG